MSQAEYWADFFLYFFLFKLIFRLLETNSLSLLPKPTCKKEQVNQMVTLAIKNSLSDEFIILLFICLFGIYQVYCDLTPQLDRLLVQFTNSLVHLKEEMLPFWVVSALTQPLSFLS